MKIIFIYTFFSGLRTGQTHGLIFMRDSSKDVRSRKDVPFWGYKTNLMLNLYLSPKTIKIGPKWPENA